MDAGKDELRPRRSGIARMIPPWEYRHLYFAYRVRFAGGTVLMAMSALILSYRAYGWAAVFFAMALTQLISAYLERRIARSTA